MTLGEISANTPAWGVRDMVTGLTRLIELRSNGERIAYNLYADADRAQAKLLYIPAEQKTHETGVILLAGGAYGAVCTMVESLPVCAYLNTLGYDCWCLNYRTAVQSDFITGLMPKPLEDIAAAVKYAVKNFGLKDYALGGFSAGGHAASMWGCAHAGARAYGLPQPRALLLAYPLITMESIPASPLKDYMCKGMFGSDYTDAALAIYNSGKHLDAEYPPVYLVKALDDDTVPLNDTKDYEAALVNAGISCRFEYRQNGGHGFGCGTGTLFEGWAARAMKFAEAAE